ncbi:hypothetical protein ACFZAU_20385 [Streptomyces sp. NPDC008238]
MSPRGEAVFLLLFGLGATFTGLLTAANADAIAAQHDQMQQDFHDAYNRGDPPDDRTRKTRRTLARTVGWVFAIIGPALAISGVVMLVRL